MVEPFNRCYGFSCFIHYFDLDPGPAPHCFLIPDLQFIVKKNTLRRPQFPKISQTNSAFLSSRWSSSSFVSETFYCFLLQSFKNIQFSKQRMKDPDFFKLIENIFESIRPKKRDKFWLKYFEKFDTLAIIHSTLYSEASRPSVRWRVGHFY